MQYAYTMHTMHNDVPPPLSQMFYDSPHIIRHDEARPTERHFIDLASNNYLGLAKDPRVCAAAQQAIEQWGVGTTGSRVVCGTVPPHHECEEALADFLGFPAALLFSSGYTANLAAVTSCVQPDDTLICDVRNHASLIDACRLTKAPRIVCDCTDPRALTNALQSAASAVVVCDVVDSTDGSVLDIATIYQATHAAGALLIADFAHGLGTLGDDGRGNLHTLWARDIAPDDCVITCTLSKALGSQGGAVLCSQQLRDHMVTTARSFIFDTALAPACAAAATEALRILSAEPDRVQALHQQMNMFAHVLDLPATRTGVMAIPLGDPVSALEAQRCLSAMGVEVGCFRPPSVPWQRSGLRIGGCAGLFPSQAQRAISTVKNVLDQLN